MLPIQETEDELAASPAGQQILPLPGFGVFCDGFLC